MKFDALIKSNPIVLVDFFAEWCGPCKMMAPVFKEIKEQVGEKIKIVKIDIDKNPALAAKFNIRSVPTMQVYKYGKLQRTIVGGLTTHEINQILKHYL